MDLKNKLKAAKKVDAKAKAKLTSIFKVSKNAIIRNGVAYTVNKKAKIVNGEVYTHKHGAYQDPKSKNIYRVVSNALVNKEGGIYTKSKQYSYVK